MSYQNDVPEEDAVMESDLAAAGWIRIGTFRWRAPTGLEYAGPRPAWLVMTGAWPVERCITPETLQ